MKYAVQSQTERSMLGNLIPSNSWRRSRASTRRVSPSLSAHRLAPMRVVICWLFHLLFVGVCDCGLEFTVPVLYFGGEFRRFGPHIALGSTWLKSGWRVRGQR
jgi:hypothetical protein